MSNRLAKLRAMTNDALGDNKKSSKSTNVVATAAPPKKISKYLTLSEAQADKKSTTLYVLNNSSNIDPNNKRSDIIMDVAMPQGDNSRVIVKDTWMPVNVASQAPRKIILSDRLFMRAIEHGLIRIITNEYAEKQLAKSDIVDEQNRLHMRDTQEILSPGDHTVDGGSQTQGVSLHVAEIFARNMSPRDRLATLKNISSTLKDADYHFIMLRCVSSQESRIKAWCEKQRLAKRR